MSINLYQKYFDALGNKDKNTMGIYDASGIIIASNNKNILGKKIMDCEIDYTAFSVPNNTGYSYFIEGDNSAVEKVAPVVLAALGTFNIFERENEDTEYLFKQIISGRGENIAYRAQSLGIEDDRTRVVFVISLTNKNLAMAHQIISEVAPVRPGDCLFINDTDELVFVRKCKSEPTNAKLMSIANQISTGIMTEIMEQPSIGIGTVVSKLNEVQKSYKAAISALEIGYVFENKTKIYSYMNLGISRLITSVPIEKCKAFLNEVLKEDILREIDADTMNTVQRFFDYDLNISLAARELYIHRNTLVYRLNNVQKLTGLDVRKFDDALLFKIAMLIQRYLRTSRR